MLSGYIFFLHKPWTIITDGYIEVFHYWERLSTQIGHIGDQWSFSVPQLDSNSHGSQAKYKTARFPLGYFDIRAPSVIEHLVTLEGTVTLYKLKPPFILHC